MTVISKQTLVRLLAQERDRVNSLRKVGEHFLNEAITREVSRLEDLIIEISELPEEEAQP